jgi:hypothetical protein
MAIAILINGFIPADTLPADDAAKFPYIVGIGFVVLAVLPLIVDRGGKAESPDDLNRVQVDRDGSEVSVDETSVLPVIHPQNDEPY